MLTKKELAKSVGVTRQALDDWEGEGLDVEGCLDLSPMEAVAWVKAWRAENKRPTYKDANEPNEDGTPQEQLLAAQIRKTNAEAVAKELKNAERRGELYEAADVELAVAELTGTVRARLESVARELESEWPAEVRQLVTQRLEDRIHLILTELSQFSLDV